MVCAKCAAKEASVSSLACTDVWKPAGKGEEDRSGGRKIGENKLLSSKKKMKVMPYMIPDMKSKSRAAAGSSSGSSSMAVVGSCKKCRTKLNKPGANYCQACAYKGGMCAMCGTTVLANKGQYKMSSK